VRPSAPRIVDASQFVDVLLRKLRIFIDKSALASLPDLIPKEICMNPGLFPDTYSLGTRKTRLMSTLICYRELP
jgi:hypothetical protein